MKQLLIISALVAALVGSTAYAARPQAILGPGTGGANFRVPFHETSNRILSKDTTYILTGWYFIDSTYSITIPAGTLIRGDSASGGTLIVRRGAKIFATGTQTKPIVFTANDPAGSRQPGDWGGVIILGKAPTNAPTTRNVEGGFGVVPGDTYAQFGGTDSADNSGILTYVRIEYAGIAFSTNNEINGLTFGGVGAGTQVDHIQVSYANDDSFEWFGGTVNCKYLISWRGLDDELDTDNGFKGKVQFTFNKRDPNLFDFVAGGISNGFECDNEGTAPFTATPITKAVFSNVTMVGPQNDTSDVINANWLDLALLRRGNMQSCFNSILMGWRNGVEIRDTLTAMYTLFDSLQMRSNIIQAPRNVVRQANMSGGFAGYNAAAWFNTPAYNNIGGTGPRNTTDVGLVNPFPLDPTVDPRPIIGSDADIAGTDFTGKASDPFFTPVSYRGAFDPHLPRDQQWDAGWSNYDPDNYDPETESIVSTSLTASWNLISHPFKETNPAPSSVYPRSISNAFAYLGSYSPSATLTHGTGYWLKFSSSETDFFRGIHNLSDTFAVAAKWNIVGSITVPVTIASIVSNPPGIVTSNYFSYTGSGYAIASTIEPGKGYWVKANTAGSLYLQGAPAAMPKLETNTIAMLNQLNTIMLSDAQGQSQKLYFGKTESNVDVNKFELPPVAPGEIFDARFVSQRMVEVSATDVKQGSRYAIALHGGVYPITAIVNLQQHNGTIELLEMANGNVVAKHTVNGNTKVTISNSAVESLVINGTESKTVPLTFALSQNYPNPFNPTTRFTVDVPEVAQVHVAVFDVLGQKVATLLNGMTEAGSHAIEWNAQDDRGVSVPSGIYFVRMNSDKFSSVRKIMLLK